MDQQTLADFTRRLNRLEAIEAIKALKARYLNACDQQDPEAVRDCFAEGEVIIDMDYFGRCENRDEFVDGIFIPRGCHEHVLDMHHCANPEITIEDDHTASGIWSLNYRNINTKDQTVTLLSALYHDQYRKQGHTWKIVRSRTQYRTVLACQYAEGTLKVGTAARSLQELG